MRCFSLMSCKDKVVQRWDNQLGCAVRSGLASPADYGGPPTSGTSCAADPVPLGATRSVSVAYILLGKGEPLQQQKSIMAEQQEQTEFQAGENAGKHERRPKAAS